MATVDWLKVKTEYISNPQISTRDLAEKYGVTYSYLAFICARDGWVEQREKTRAKVEQKLSEKLPETIADVKLRHARIGRNLQSTGLIAIVGNDKSPALRPNSYGDAVNALTKGIQIERIALGLNEKEVQDEVYQKFSQFTFIFNLNQNELQNFIRSAIARGLPSVGPVGEPIRAATGEGAGERGLATA